MRAIPSIFENFNAKFLTVKQITEGFIVNSAFRQLAGQYHNLLVGPRGSGKTTLLKMLQVETLGSWLAPEAEAIREVADFTGVFIPTDPVWARQYRDIEARIGGDPYLKTCLKSVFTYHVLECLSDALVYRAPKLGQPLRFRQVSLDTSVEVNLVDKLAALWSVSPRLPSFRELRDAVIYRVHELGTWFTSNVAKSVSESNQVGTTPGELVQVITTTVKLINAALNEPDGKWCLLFDELELAPSTILAELMPVLRGGSNNIIYKLSLVPFVEEESVQRTFFSAHRDHDYKRIDLTNTSHWDMAEFAKALSDRIFVKNGLVSPADAYFEKPKPFDYSAATTSLVQKDPGFKVYMETHKMEVRDLPNGEDDGRPELRKLRWVIMIRDYYLHEEGGRKPRRSAASFYGGFPNICAALEYNPRMLIGTMSRLAEHAAKDGSITLSQQLAALDDTERAFSAQINTVPTNLGRIETLPAFVERLAGYCRDSEILGTTFAGEPRGTYTTTEKTSEAVLQAVKNALNTGAMVLVSSDTNTLISGDSTKRLRVRLSYLFSQRYRLPMTLLREVDLEQALSGRASGADTGQLELI